MPISEEGKKFPMRFAAQPQITNLCTSAVDNEEDDDEDDDDDCSRSSFSCCISRSMFVRIA